MLDNLSTIIKKGDKGDIASMIEFVKDYELLKASKEEPDIKERRIQYLTKLVESEIPFAYQELAFSYEEDSDYKKALPLLEKASELGNTFAMEHLGKYYFFGEHVEQNYEKAYEYFSKATEQDMEPQENVSICYPFVAHLFLGEMYRRGLYVEADIKKSSKHYGDACWISIEGYEPESDEMVIATYWHALERLGKISGGEYQKNIVEALALLELTTDWEFSEENLLKKLELSKQMFIDAYEECKSEIKKLYPSAKYIVVNTGKYVIAKSEKDNQIMNFEDDLEARKFVSKHHDPNGSAEKSVKFVLNTETWETLYE